jgi:putative FmdB family regulatory protein
MPIYEYNCEECSKHFDKFVRSANAKQEFTCPECGSDNVKKAFSVFGVSGGSTAGASAGANCAPTGG